MTLHEDGQDGHATEADASDKTQQVATTAHGSQAPPTPRDETIHTTERHPWLTTDRGWVQAGDLHVGEHVVELDGRTATITALVVHPGAADYYNLTVSTLHTYAVGNHQAVVHNTNGEGCGEVPWGFKGQSDFEEFGAKLKSGLAEAGYRDTQVAFQGSSVTGVKYTTGAAFDVGRVSDYDIALAGEDIFGKAQDAGIGLRSGGIRTGPLRPVQLDQLGLTGLRDALSTSVGRPVNFMIYRSLEDALARAPSIVVP